MSNQTNAKECRGADGRFLETNRFWRARLAHGRPPVYEDAEELWQACCGYFDWVEEHPLLEDKAVMHQGKVSLARAPKMRAMTIVGLCNFLGITRTTWLDWRKRRADLSEVIERVEAVIWQQKFEGAAAGLLNANIISRELRLLEKADEAVHGKAEPDKPQLSDTEVARRVAFLLYRGAKDEVGLAQSQ